MKKMLILSIVILLSLSSISPLFSGGKWYNHYDKGSKLMRRQLWAKAIVEFTIAIKTKNKDTKRIKTYGMHFIEYFPNREIGICFYNLGQNRRAKNRLNISLSQEYSYRAQQFLSKLQKAPMDNKTVISKPNKIKKRIIDPLPVKKEVVIDEPIPESSEIKLVGERMGLAVLPFQTTGFTGDISEINIIEQMMTSFYNLNRFKLFERTQLEKIIEEQKLGMSGLIDASTAAEIGKGIGVDAIVLGSITRAGGSISIDARLIDTGTAEIITAQNEMSRKTSIEELKDMIQRLVSKIGQDLPLVEGYVIGVDGELLTLDLGSNKGIKKGMKCIIYREGQDIIHPITKKKLGKRTEELGAIKLREVYPEYSVGKLIQNQSKILEIGNKVVTK